MNIFKKFYARAYQGMFRIILPLLPYKEPKILRNMEEVANLYVNKNISSVLLVTDDGIRTMGLTKELEEKLKTANINCVVYDKTQPNPTVNNVEDARLMYIQNNCNGIIAFGGGSSMDCAKAVGARIVYPKKQLNKLKGLLKVKRKLPTFVAIPTTAGTGSEVTLTAVISNPENKHKYTINSFPLIPHYAVLDPKTTLTLPPKLTATTGMDALTHAVEAYIGRSTTRLTRKMALSATKLVFENILEAYNNGQNLTARQNMLNAAYMAGIAFSRSYVGYIHSVAHSLGGQYNIPHGLANAVIMPVVLEKYGKSAYKKLHQLAMCVGLSSKEESAEVGATKFINAIKDLNKNMQIPTKIDGIKEEDISLMAEHAENEANPLYPVPKLFTAKELEDVYRKIM